MKYATRDSTTEQLNKEDMQIAQPLNSSAVREWFETNNFLWPPCFHTKDTGNSFVHWNPCNLIQPLKHRSIRRHSVHQNGEAITYGEACTRAKFVKELKLIRRLQQAIQLFQACRCISLPHELNGVRPIQLLFCRILYSTNQLLLHTKLDSYDFQVSTDRMWFQLHERIPTRHTHTCKGRCVCTTDRSPKHGHLIHTPPHQIDKRTYSPLSCGHY